MIFSEIRKRTFAAATLVSLFLFAYYLSNPFLFQRLVNIKTLSNKAVFVIVHVVAMLCMLAAAFSSKKIFYAVAIVSFLSIFLDNCFFLVKHYAITLSDLSVLFISVGNTLDVVSQFRVDLIRAFATASFLLLSLLLLRRLVRERRYASQVVLTLCGLSFCFYLLIAVFKGEPSLVALPSNNTLPFGGSVLSVDSVIQRLKTPKPFVATKRNVPLVEPPKHIILIIDESVEAEKFRDLNKQPFANAVDFGFALSGANCSASSNLILRAGPDILALSKTILATPRLFELAKRANFKTVFFDLQGVLSDTAVRDYFSNQELAAVDRVYRRTEFGGKNFERDLRFAERFSNLLSKEDKVFAIVNKSGSHFPYASNLPPDLARTTDSYATSVSFSTIAFLHEIDSTLPDSTIVFYTSDHGQNFLAKSPHCNGASDSTLSEWRVPLIVFLTKDLTAIRERLNSSWNNRASHFELTETIRVLLGYEAMFDKSLFDPPGNVPSQPYKAYFGPIKGLLGRPASFREFDRSTLGQSALGGSLTVAVPSGAITGNILVTVSGANTNGVAFTVLPTPAITNLSPTAGPVTTSVTITGTGFGANRGSSTVTFNGATAAIASWNTTSIVTIVPIGATTGNVVVSLVGVASNGVSFTVTAPTLASIAVTPANQSILVAAILQFKVTGIYVDTTTQDLTSSATWSSTDTTVATINSSGLATAVALGQTTIQASVGSLNGSTTLGVVSSGARNVARLAHTATLLTSGKVLLAGGSGSPNVLGSAELHDPSTGIFSLTGSLNSSLQLSEFEIE
jgi:glucan phosphoethanolaminetransferase (alkaline phosphatase superfamily)